MTFSSTPHSLGFVMFNFGISHPNTCAKLTMCTFFFWFHLWKTVGLQGKCCAIWKFSSWWVNLNLPNLLKYVVFLHHFVLGDWSDNLASNLPNHRHYPLNYQSSRSDDNTPPPWGLVCVHLVISPHPHMWGGHWAPRHTHGFHLSQCPNSLGFEIFFWMG